MTVNLYRHIAKKFTKRNDNFMTVNLAQAYHMLHNSKLINLYSYSKCYNFSQIFLIGKKLIFAYKTNVTQLVNISRVCKSYDFKS